MCSNLILFPNFSFIIFLNSAKRSFQIQDSLFFSRGRVTSVAAVATVVLGVPVLSTFTVEVFLKVTGGNMVVV